MNNKLKLSFALTALFIAPLATAQDSLVDYLIVSCATELESYCSEVTPGNGRLLHCIAAHEDKLSGQCEYGLYKAATLLEELAVAVNYVAQECATELQTVCSDVELGEGRVVACLKENPDEVSDACKTAISDTVGE